VPELFFSFFSCFDVCMPVEHTWIYFLVLFYFVVHSLYSCEPRLILFVIFAIHSLYSYGPGAVQAIFFLMNELFKVMLRSLQAIFKGSSASVT